MPHLEVCVAGREAGDEVDAGLHHRRGVQVGRDRGGRGHRRGQPEVERHERALRDGPDEDEGDAPFAGDPGDRVRDELGDRGGAALDGQQYEADEHGESAEGRHGERLQRGTAALAAAGVVADEQVGEDARRLPEHEHHVDVVGGDEAEHDAGEGEEQGGEAAERGLVVAEVPGAVRQHERADAGDDEREQQGEPVEAEGQGDIERLDPLDPLGDDAPGDDLGEQGEQPAEHGGGEQGDDEEDPPADQPRQQGRQQGEGAEHDEAEEHSPSSRRNRPGSSVPDGSEVYPVLFILDKPAQTH